MGYTNSIFQNSDKPRYRGNTLLKRVEGMTYLEVLDTAIKVGLGAVIAGVTGYFLAVTNHKKN